MIKLLIMFLLGITPKNDCIRSQRNERLKGVPYGLAYELKHAKTRSQRDYALWRWRHKFQPNNPIHANQLWIAAI